MADLVIDEWLWADLNGENNREKQKETFLFIKAVYRKCDRVVTVKGSKFTQKGFDLWKQTDLIRREIAKYFKSYFWSNTFKSFLLDMESLNQLEEPIYSEVKDDDHYLVQACNKIHEAIIVTTDHPLKSILEKYGIACRLRDEFVREYLSLYGV